MPRTLVRILATGILTIAMAGVSSPAFAGPGARTRVVPRTTNFAGSYVFHVTVGSRPGTCKVLIKANGTAIAKCTGKTAHWTAAGTKITIVYKSPGITETFKGTKTPAGINTKAHPGSYSNTRGQTGTWYAVYG